MDGTKLTFPVKSFKRFDDPYDQKNEAAKYQFFMNVKDVPEILQNWLKVNPREQKLSTDVARDIAKSLEDDKLNFHLLNRGMLISAEDISYDNKERMVTMILNDPQKHGIVDGGHTFRQIIKFKQSLDNDAKNKFVQVEVITKVVDIEELAEARNNSVAVDDKSIEELKGSFDEIKKIIGDQVIGEDQYFNRISFRQNEFWGNKEITNVIDVREIIAIINMFNPVLYDPINIPHPIQSYTGKEVSLNKFLKLAPIGSKSKDGDRIYRDKVIRNMRDIIPDIFSLWDVIETQFAQVSRDLNKRYGSKSYSNYNNKVKKVSLFSNRELNYTIPKGIMYPVLGAFRALVSVDKKTEKCYWEINPFKVWEERRENMVTTVLDNSSSFGNSPDQIGKSSLIWDSLFNPILIYRLTSNGSLKGKN